MLMILPPSPIPTITTCPGQLVALDTQCQRLQISSLCGMIYISLLNLSLISWVFGRLACSPLPQLSVRSVASDVLAHSSFRRKIWSQ